MNSFSKMILLPALVLLLILPFFSSCGGAEATQTKTPAQTQAEQSAAEEPSLVTAEEPSKSQTPVETPTETQGFTETPTDEPTTETPSQDTPSPSTPTPNEEINEGLSFKIENGKATVWCSKKNIKDVVIPAKIAGFPVVEVAAKGFKDMAKIRSLSLPEGLLKIGESAFEGCASLTSVVLPESLLELGERAFFGCSELASFSIGHNLKKLPQNCLSVGKLTELVIPEGVEEIYYACVDQRLTPEDLTVTLPRSLKKLAAGFSLTGGYGRLIVNAPDLETWYALDSTREMIYDTDYYVNKLDPLSEVIPAGSPVTITWRRIIGSFELQIDGVPVTEVLLPNGVTEIPDYCYAGVSSLESVVLPEGVTAVKANAFRDTALREIEFPSSLRALGDGALSGTQIEILTVPGTVTEVGEISEMPLLGILELEEGVEYFGGISYCPTLSVLTLPASVTKTSRSTLVTDAYIYCVNGKTTSGGLYDCSLVSECPLLNNITVAEENPLFATSNSGKLRRKTNPFLEYKEMILSMYPDEAPEDAILLAFGTEKEYLEDIKMVYRAYLGGDLPDNFDDWLLENRLKNRVGERLD